MHLILIYSTNQSYALVSHKTAKIKKSDLYYYIVNDQYKTFISDTIQGSIEHSDGESKNEDIPMTNWREEQTKGIDIK